MWAAPSASTSTAPSSSDPKIVYPESKKGDVVDDYFGTKVADPYRWLEDNSDATKRAKDIFTACDAEGIASGNEAKVKDSKKPIGHDRDVKYGVQ